MPSDDEAHVAGLLMAGVEACRDGRMSDAVEPLSTAMTALADQPDLRDFYARACSLLAQARLETGDARGARQAAHAAMRACRDVSDLEGLAEVRALDERIAAELDSDRRAELARARATELAAETADVVESKAASPLARADALLKHAGALKAHERFAEAAHSAERAIANADAAESVREQTLARIALAEVDATRATTVLREALELADRADETTLIGLVARAAELADVALPQQYGPSMGSPHTEENQ